VEVGTHTNLKAMRDRNWICATSLGGSESHPRVGTYESKRTDWEVGGIDLVGLDYS